jgi:predicted Zn-ribbon and HTH transcriptional regulator
MTTLSNDIINILNSHKEPLSIHDLIVLLPNYKVHDIKTEVWHLTADGLAKFDMNWKISKANDGPATY